MYAYFVADGFVGGSSSLEGLLFRYNGLRNLLSELHHFSAVFLPSLDPSFLVKHIFDGYSYEGLTASIIPVNYQSA
jgi:hypothetical protein